MKTQLTLKELRRSQLRMTQTEFAEALGVSRRSVARYEATGAPASILKLAAHLLKRPHQRVSRVKPIAQVPAHT